VVHRARHGKNDAQRHGGLDWIRSDRLPHARNASAVRMPRRSAAEQTSALAPTARGRTLAPNVRGNNNGMALLLRVYRPIGVNGVGDTGRWHADIRRRWAADRRGVLPGLSLDRVLS